MTTNGWRDVAAERARPLVVLLGLDALVLAGFAVLLPIWSARPPAATFGAYRHEHTVALRLFLLGLGLFLVTAVLWLRWFHAVARRAEATGATRFRSGWWFWAWVIPGASLVLPKMMVNDIWHAPRGAARREPLPGVIQSWWAATVIVGVLNYLDRTRDAGLWGRVVPVAWFFVFEALRAGLAIGAVRQITRRNALLGPVPGAPPAYSAGVEPPSTGTTQPVT